MLFSRTPLQVDLDRRIEQPAQEAVANTIGLWQASLEDAVRYGGDVTREALSVMSLRGDRKYTVVDTKVHMLMPGLYPALPGWHTDGVPRGEGGNPLAKAPPNIQAQEETSLRPPRFHLLVTGEGCLTDFLTTPTHFDVPSEPSTLLYQSITRQVTEAIEVGNLTGVDFFTVRTMSRLRMGLVGAPYGGDGLQA
jgi:hypothetical protein